MVNRSRLLLLACLVLTLCAVAWVAKMDSRSDDVVAPVSAQADKPRKRDADKTQAADPLVLGLDKLQRSPMTVTELNPFGPKSWFVPPPPPPPAPPAKPTAPPFPFVYQGKMEEDAGRWAVYLMKGDQLFVVHKGETFDNAYRLDGIENGNLMIQYLPLSIKQTLPIGR